MNSQPRRCLREPIPEIFEAARLLDDAVSSHLAGDHAKADGLIRAADLPAIREWTESLWGTLSEYHQVREVPGAPVSIPRAMRLNLRMPTTAAKRALLERDGYHCRFCGIPVIREVVRSRMRHFYSDALPWGRTNLTQHAAFQALWVQYDHLLPHARGGDNSVHNMVITCGPCNFGRGDYTLEEMGLIDPRTREPVRSGWDGLERILASQEAKASRAPKALKARPSLQQPKSPPTTASAFLAAVSSEASPFFVKVLDEAQKRALLVSFGSKGFSVRAMDRPMFFYCYPPGASSRVTSDIEIFLSDLGDPALGQEMRERFLQVPGVQPAGKFTIRLPVSQATMNDAERIWETSLEFMARQINTSA